MEPNEQENDRSIPDDPGIAQDQERQWLGDHPEAAPDESRNSVVTGNPDQAPVRRTANTGDLDQETGPPASGPGPAAAAAPGLNAELGFERNTDFMGDDAAIAETEEFARGSGFLPGKLWGEEALGAGSGEPGKGEATSPRGFDPTAKQESNRASAQPGTGPEAALPPQADLRFQGRDEEDRPQVTGIQAFGRDVGASGLAGDREVFVEAENPPNRPRRSSEWTAILGRLGGSSPGSEENAQLAEKFSAVRFPAPRDEVLRLIPPGTEFRARGLAVDLREAVADSRAREFRTLYDLIDAVKDEIRRAERRQANPG